MRLHTDVLTERDILNAVKELPGVHATVTEHGSRDCARSFEVRLEGNGTAAGYATKNHTGATWDEWGAFIAALYERDVDARWGSKGSPVYTGYDDFHYQTGSRFEYAPGFLPADTHKRHKWEWSYGKAYCSKCMATINRL